MKNIKIKVKPTFGHWNKEKILDATLLIQCGDAGLCYIQESDKNCPILLFCKKDKKYWIENDDKPYLNLDSDLEINSLQEIETFILKGAL